MKVKLKRKEKEFQKNQKNKLWQKYPHQKLTILEKISGAGIMDCKNALVEANGDTEAAIEILRKKDKKLQLKELTENPLKVLP